MSQQTRHIGAIIKEQRKRQHMTGEELGRLSGLSQSKISKIETGYYAQLQPLDIKNILNILNAPSTITQQVMRLLSEDIAGPLLPSKLEAVFSAQATDYEKQSKLIRIYASNIVPALLQTVEYRTAMLRHYNLPDDQIEIILKETMRRQDLLWSGERQYHVIMPQAALYTFVTTKPILLAQLDRLERMANVPRLKLGILPMEAGLTFVENSSFALYDDHTVIQALARMELTSQAKEDISLHNTVFNALEHLACYNADTLKLIHRAATYFS